MPASTVPLWATSTAHGHTLLPAQLVCASCVSRLTPVFAASGLTDGPHNIVVTNVGQGVNGSFFDFDYVQYNTSVDPAPSGSVSVSTALPTPSTAPTTTNVVGTDSSGTSRNNGNDGQADTSSGPGSRGGGSNTGAIIGGVFGGLVTSALLWALIWWFCLRKRKDEKEDQGGSQPRIDLSEGREIKPSFNAPSDAEAAYAAAAGYATYSDYSSSQHYSHDRVSQSRQHVAVTPEQPTALPYLTGVPPPPASSAASYPHSIDPPSSIGVPGTIYEGLEEGHYSRSYSPNGGQLPAASFARAVPGVSSAGSADSDNDSPISVPNSCPTTPSASALAKSSGVGLPFTAHSHGASSVDTTGRLTVEGRPMDLGPIAVEGDDVHDETLVDGMPPPDYRQATQPLPGQRPPGAAVW